MFLSSIQLHIILAYCNNLCIRYVIFYSNLCWELMCASLNCNFMYFKLMKIMTQRCTALPHFADWQNNSRSLTALLSEISFEIIKWWHFNFCYLIWLLTVQFYYKFHKITPRRTWLLVKDIIYLIYANISLLQICTPQSKSLC